MEEETNEGRDKNFNRLDGIRINPEVWLILHRSVDIIFLSFSLFLFLFFFVLLLSSTIKVAIIEGIKGGEIIKRNN